MLVERCQYSCVMNLTHCGNENNECDDDTSMSRGGEGWLTEGINLCVPERWREGDGDRERSGQIYHAYYPNLDFVLLAENNSRKD